MIGSINLPRAGAPVSSARAAAVMIHGRGASAESILSLAEAFAVDGVAYVAPQAPGGSWYPYSFLAPFEQNEPHLTRALGTIDATVRDLASAGIGSDRIVLAGFSQGACLALDYAARHAQRFGGVIAFSGGLIGPPGAPRAYHGSLEGSPVFIGCSDVDAHIPLACVRESADVMRRLGGDVVEQIYPGMAHTIIEDEIVHARRILASVAQAARGD